jgi:hypothetical protein
VLTVVGWARMKRPWYLCPNCHQGQFPADAELDIERTDFSPGVRRMRLWWVRRLPSITVVSR